MDDSSTLPVTIDASGNRVSTLDQLADIPEEEIWLAKQKSVRTRRAYRLLDVMHFTRTLGIASAEELHQVHHRLVLLPGHRSPPPQRAAGVGSIQNDPSDAFRMPDRILDARRPTL